MKAIKKIYFFILILVGVILLSGIIWMKLFIEGAKKAKEYTNEFHPKMELLEDGSYSGQFSYCFGIINASLNFEIQDNRIIFFSFERLTGTPGYGAEEAIEKLIDSTKIIPVDALGGATLTTSLTNAAIKDAVITKIE